MCSFLTIIINTICTNIVRGVAVVAVVVVVVGVVGAAVVVRHPPRHHQQSKPRKLGGKHLQNGGLLVQI